MWMAQFNTHPLEMLGGMLTDVIFVNDRFLRWNDRQSAKQ
jgi:hypothetical protein